MRRAILIVAALLATAATGCGDNDALPQGSDTVSLDPADFTTTIDNPYLPMSRAITGSTARPTWTAPNSASRSR